jgi:hypothetical protein
MFLVSAVYMCVLLLISSSCAYMCVDRWISRCLWS